MVFEVDTNFTGEVGNNPDDDEDAEEFSEASEFELLDPSDGCKLFCTMPAILAAAADDWGKCEELR